MKRDEEIWNAIFKLRLGEHSDDGSLGNDEYSGDDLQNAFYSGAKWADSNPKSPWISVDEDLPCNHSDLVLTYNDIPFSTERVLVMTDIHTLFLCDMKKDNNRGWIWNYSTKDKITHWFPIPELPKEQEVELWKMN